MNLDKLLHESDALYLVPLGGLGEIGMNLMALVHKGKAIILDSGVLFPEPNSLGVDLVVPDIDFFKEYDLIVEACVFTHAHEDHIGSIAFLYDQLGQPPIYATAYTFGMFEERLQQYSSFKRDRFRRILLDRKFSIGAFEFEPLRVTHSMSECLGFAIKTPIGTLVHTGDFKIDRTPLDGYSMQEERFKELGNEGVLLFMSDSTNVESEGWTQSETELHQSLRRIITGIKQGRIFVTMFSSNIPRIQGLLEIAKEAGRKVSFCGRSVVSNVELARQVGLLKFSDEDVVPARRADEMAMDKILFITTGTQAEPRSAMMKMALQIHPDVDLQEGDTVLFSSRHIPGNEKKISTLFNQIYRCGARVIDFREDFVHVSGHAQEEELKSVLSWVKPRFFLPVHGEYRMLVKHGELCKKFFPSTRVLVAENGAVLELKPDHFRQVTRVNAGKKFYDENRNLLPEEVIRDRRKLGLNGLIVINAVLRQKDSRLVSGPEILTMGLMDEVDLVNLKEEIREFLEDLKRSNDLDLEAAEEEIRLMARRHYRKALGLKPVVISRIYEV